MELKAQYDFDDILDLVEQDLAAKGFQLVGGLSPELANSQGEFKLMLAIEQLTETAHVPATPVQTLTPAPAVTTPTPKGKKIKGVSRVGKTEEQLAKQREYRHKSEEKKKTLLIEQARQETQTEQALQLPEVVAPSTVPFHYQPSNELSLNK